MLSPDWIPAAKRDGNDRRLKGIPIPDGASAKAGLSIQASEGSLLTGIELKWIMYLDSYLSRTIIIIYLGPHLRDKGGFSWDNLHTRYAIFHQRFIPAIG